MKPSRFTTNDLRIGNFVTFRLIVPLLVAVVPADTAAPIEAGQTSTREKFERHSAYFSRAAGRCGQSDVALRAGPESEIFIANPLGGNATDSCLYVLDDGFGVAASGDDSDGKLQAQITFTPSALDTDNVRLTAYSCG